MRTGACLIACMCLLAGSAGRSPAFSGAPASWGGSASYGYNTNILSSSYAERAAFDRHDPQYWFVVNRLQDWEVDAGLWARWDVPGLYARRNLRLEIDFDRRQVIHNPVLGLNTWTIALRQRFRNHQRYVDFSFQFEPQVYLRHRGDTAAAPGQPVFRPEAYRDAEARLAYNHTFGAIGAGLFALHDGRREDRWFRWRDESRNAAGISLQSPQVMGFNLSPSFEFGSCRSVGDLLNPVDRSYREEIPGIFASWSGPFANGSGRGPWKVELGGRLKFRTYTTADPLESSRFHRHDLLYSWSVRVARQAGDFSPFVAAEGAGRRVSLPAGATASTDESQYGAALIRLGAEWEMNRR